MSKNLETRVTKLENKIGDNEELVQVEDMTVSRSTLRRVLNEISGETAGLPHIGNKSGGNVHG